MFIFGLSKEEVLSQKHVVSYKEISKQTPISSMVTLFGRQVYPVKSESSKSGDGYMRINSSKLLMKDIDLRLPADHYPYHNFHETFNSGKFCSFDGSRNNVELGLHSALEGNRANDVPATSWSGQRNPKIVIDLEEPPTTEHEYSVSNVTVRNAETKPPFLSDLISSNLLKVVDQSLVEDGSDNRVQRLLDLNREPADEMCLEPHYCFLQDLNCPYIEETETSCEKSGVDDGPAILCSPKCQNVHEKDGTASPASYTSCCTTENNSRMESRGSSSPRALEPSCRTRLEFPVTEVLPENGCCNKEEDLSEVIHMAAESLVHISAALYQNQDLQSKHVSIPSSLSQDRGFPDEPEMVNAEPRCCTSYDSYELHTLGISETNTEEDFCVTSMALDELNKIARDNNKEIGVKLRRGRRMKNFQKEILPSLTSLSRPEIREDINILEAVLRSREYKKLKGKTKYVKFGENPRIKRSSSQRYAGKRRRRDE